MHSASNEKQNGKLCARLEKKDEENEETEQKLTDLHKLVSLQTDKRIGKMNHRATANKWPLSRGKR